MGVISNYFQLFLITFVISSDLSAIKAVIYFNYLFFVY